MQTSDWRGCYNDNWKAEITPASFAHPAKFSRGLIRRIYQHILTEGWVAPGDCIIDPFGGVSLGGLDAIKAGLNWLGVELEPKFVEMGNANIALWQAMADKAAAWGLNSWGKAQLLQGDSRYLASVLAEMVGCAISSPPYTGDALGHDAGCVRLDAKEDERRAANGSGRRDGYGGTPGNLGTMVVSSPPYAESLEKRGGIDPDKSKHIGGPHSQMNNSDTRYGQTSGQLGAMAVSSPPYAASLASDDPDKRGGLFKDPKRANDKTLTAEYGSTEGQLGAMAVSSPPYSGKAQEGRTSERDRRRLERLHPDLLGRFDTCFRAGEEYGANPDNLGNTNDNDFWLAARQVISQLRLVLRPDAHAMFVCKRFVRDGKIVEFSQQWAGMCQSLGFEMIHWHRAWLVEERGTQFTLEGEVKRSTKARKSFFRRLYENSHPENSIDWEDVLCFTIR